MSGRPAANTEAMSALKTEIEAHGVESMTVGYVSTAMHLQATERLAAEAGVTVDEMAEQRYAGVALRRPGSPEEIASTIAFLAGPSSAYITGAAIPVSGGTPVGL